MVVTVSRKPFQGTLVSNTLEHRSGGLNIDSCRIETDECLSGGGVC